MTYDLLVIGGGVLGTFHALHAIEAGLTVGLVERHIRPQGATVRNFGQIVPSGLNSQWQPYGRRSLAIYQHIQQQVDISIRQEGSIYIASNEEELGLLEELAQINQANGYASRLLSAAACKKRYPSLKSSYAVGGLFFPEEISVDPRLMIHRVRSWLVEQKGLHYFPQTTIHTIEPLASGARLMDHQARQFEAKQVILCGGDEFQTLLPTLFKESDLQVSQLQMLRLKPHTGASINGNVLTGLSIRRYESFSECPSYPKIKAKEDPNSPWKKWGVHILFKQADDGTVILGDSHAYADVDAVEELGFDIHAEVNEYIISEAQAIFDLTSWDVQQSWFGRYAQCKTQDIFRANWENCVQVVTGIGGKGMTASPGYAEFSLKQTLNL